MKKQVTINKEQARYVIPAGDGYSCLGFDVLQERGRALAGELWSTWEHRRGSMAAYTHYSNLQRQAASRYKATGERCKCGLTPQLIGLEGKRVEVVTNHGEKARFKVGRSTGWIPCHIALARRDSTGGGAVTGAPFRSVRIVG